MSPNDGVTRILNLDAQQLDRAAELEKLRRNITVLFTDIKGSTAYFEKFGDLQISNAGASTSSSTRTTIFSGCSLSPNTARSIPALRS